MRLHKHDWTWRGQGYLEWVPGLNKNKQWVSFRGCTKCPELRADVRDLIGDKR